MPQHNRYRKEAQYNEHLYKAIKLIGAHIGDESMAPCRFHPSSPIDQEIVRLARDIYDWEQDFYNEQNKAKNRLG